MDIIDILERLIKKVKEKGQYDVKNQIDESLLVTELLLGELLDPENSYDYKEKSGIYYYQDSENIRFCVRMTYNPGRVNFCELKTWWVEPETKKIVYDYLPPNTSGFEQTRRSDTTAKIFRDEILPKFKSQTFSNLLVFNPVNSKRFQFSLRLIKKFIPKDWEIEEKFPKQIIIKKPD